MKKTYQAPSVTLVNVSIGNTILAGSPDAKTEGYNPNGVVLSRHSSFSWDEDYYDEEDFDEEDV